jgi:hypothetical protein
MIAGRGGTDIVATPVESMVPGGEFTTRYRFGFLR